jgi:nucleotide-binding universal stress UspA family protein
MIGVSPDVIRVDARDERPPSLAHVLVASTGEPFDRRVLDGAVKLAGPNRPVMHVVSIARIWGTALGLQHPGLYPTKKEWRAQADLVEDAVKDLKRRGFEADGRVIGSRHPGKAIARAAGEAGCDAIVMASRRIPAWRRLLQGNDERAVARRVGIPVHVVDLEPDPVNRGQP